MFAKKNFLKNFYYLFYKNTSYFKLLYEKTHAEKTKKSLKQNNVENRNLSYLERFFPKGSVFIFLGNFFTYLGTIFLFLGKIFMGKLFIILGKFFIFLGKFFLYFADDFLGTFFIFLGKFFI